jgi:hypothetical protein
MLLPGVWGLCLVCLAAPACSTPYGETPVSDLESTNGQPTDRWGTEAAPAPTPAPAPAPASGVVTLARGLAFPTGIAASNTTVFWTEHNATGSVRAMPLEGGAIRTLREDADEPGSITIRNGVVFWANPLGHALRSIKEDGTAFAELWKSALEQPTTVAVASTEAFFTTADGQVRHAKLDGTLPATVGSTSANEVTMAAERPIWVEQGRIVRTAASGTGTENVASEMGCTSVAANGSIIYWARHDTGEIRASVAGFVMTLASAELGPHSIVADASGVYWLTDDGKVRSVSTGGGASMPKTIASGFLPSTRNAVKTLALTDKYVVWLDFGTTDGKVLRAAK